MVAVPSLLLAVLPVVLPLRLGTLLLWGILHLRGILRLQGIFFRVDRLVGGG